LTRVLLVDDEPAIVQAITYALEREGFEVDAFGDGLAARDAFSDVYDVSILDIMLPGVSGLDLCRSIRATSSIPIIMLTARDTEIDVVRGLEVGADDYVTKPFRMAELVSRVRAHLRRRELDRSVDASVRTVGRLRIDLSRYEVMVGERLVSLTPSELKLLSLLASEPERVFSRRQIMQHLWGAEHVGDEHSADVHISNLRRKLEDEPSAPRLVVTVRGFGYKLTAA
jgi:two-component system response regulator RegX3